ncbi:21634_t:CDS:2, partial [Gigaspora margarita]
SRLVGQALISNKIVESYEWVFQTLVMNTRAMLLMIITDNDLAVNAANLIKNLKGKLREQYNEFSTYWYQMHNSLLYNQFDNLWNELLAKFSNTTLVFTTRIQVTQYVEGQNAIIKSLMNGNILLINLTKHINEQISRASTFIQYKHWAHSITDLELQLDSIKQFDLSTQCNLDKQSNIFVEDAVDAPAILIQELILSTEQNAKTLGNNEQFFSDLSFCLLEISFSNIHAEVSYHKAYITANDLSKKAIKLDWMLVLEDEDEDILNSSSSDKDFVVVKNPIVHSKRSVPKKRDLKDLM